MFTATMPTAISPKKGERSHKTYLNKESDVFLCKYTVVSPFYNF